MQKYVLVTFLKPLEEGFEFSAAEWPLHVTLASNFVVDWENTGLFKKLEGFVASRKPILTTAAEDAYFGPQQQVHVTTLEMNPELVVLHSDIIALLKSAEATFDEPKYIGDGYRAHVTIQPDNRLQAGDQVSIDELTIVDMFPNQDINRRRVLQNLKFLG